MMRRLLPALIALLALSRAAQADPDALWKIVNEKCVPNWREYGEAKPCAMVDSGVNSQGGYAVLKDLVGDTQYLLIPTAKVTGIEDAQLLAPAAPNYFADAWAERHFVTDAAKRELPRDMLSLAVNSIYGRSQNQLHIHLDCVAPAVRAAIAENIAAIADRWGPFAVPLAGHRYSAIRIAGDNLGAFDPFRSLADYVPGAREAMANQTLVAVGAVFEGGAPGFVILADHADLATADSGAGEELQDHSCALARH
jgi:CDP-diacylglycerol pyrophosphatase